jgi:hypothetical protein
MTMSGIMEVADNPEGTSIKLTPEQLRARRARSIAISLAPVNESAVLGKSGGI